MIYFLIYYTIGLALASNDYDIVSKNKDYKEIIEFAESKFKMIKIVFVIFCALISPIIKIASLVIVIALTIRNYLDK